MVPSHIFSFKNVHSYALLKNSIKTVSLLSASVRIEGLTLGCHTSTLCLALRSACNAQGLDTIKGKKLEYSFGLQHLQRFIGNGA